MEKGGKLIILAVLLGCGGIWMLQLGGYMDPIETAILHAGWGIGGALICSIALLCGMGGVCQFVDS